MNRSSLPRKTRNQQIYYAAMQTASKQLSCALSKDLRKKYGEWVYGDREVLRKKFKNDKHAYRKAKDELRIKTGERYFED